MTNEVGKAMFSRAGELGVPVGFLCMKVLQFFLTAFKPKWDTKDKELLGKVFLSLDWLLHSSVELPYLNKQFCEIKITLTILVSR